MAERIALAGPDIFAIYNDDYREVYFEKLLSANSRASCRKPDGYEVQNGFRVIEAPQRWPSTSSSWVV
jgi:hypothetical protein